jgi:hypothetical protein
MIGGIPALFPGFHAPDEAEFHLLRALFVLLDRRPDFPKLFAAFRFHRPSHYHDVAR